MTEPIKILHVVHSLQVGGLENGVVNLINTLNGPELSHVVCCLTRSGKLAERIESSTVRIIELGISADRFRFPLLRIRQMLKQVRPNVLHTRGWATVDAIIAGRLAGVPAIVHGEHGREAADPEGRNRKRNTIRRLLAPLVDRFVTVSEDLRLWMTQRVGIPPAKVQTIRNGVDTAKFKPLASASPVANGAVKSDLRVRLGIPFEGILVGTVGRLDPVKDHWRLMRAFAPLGRGEIPVRLIIVGDGPARAGIEAEARRLAIADKVVFTGERQDVDALLRTIDVFALTSVAEGISNTLLEAMASGLPVVATRVGGNIELVDHGVTGELVSAGDVREITAALSRYVNDSNMRKEHGRSGRLRAEQCFSLDRMAAQYAELYWNLSGARAGEEAERAPQRA